MGALVSLALVAVGSAVAQEVASVDLDPQLPAEWRGSCDLVVLTSDEEGQPVAGVQVSLRLGESTSVLRGLATDEQGRLVLSGLAAGEWLVELQREGFMLYSTYLMLEPGKEPEVGFKSRQRTGSFWAPLEAVFLAGEDRISPAVRAGRKSVKQAEKDARRQAKQEEQARRRREREVRRGRAAQLVASAEPEPEQSEESAPDTRRPTATRSTGVARSETANEAKPEPESESPDRAGRAPVPSPSPPVTPAPRPPAVPDAPVAPRLLPNPDLLPAGACPECRPGEWSVSTQSTASPSGSCAAGAVEPAMERLAGAVAEQLTGPLAGYAGAVWARDGNDVLRLLPEALEQELRALVEPIMGAGTSCPVVAVLLPEGARYVGFRYAAGERASMAECPPGQGCLIGGASWRGNPTIRDAGTLELVWSQFENASAQRERTPRLTVYFEPARTWLPPSR